MNTDNGLSKNNNPILLRALFALSVLWLTLIWSAPVLVASRFDLLKYIGTTIYFFMDPVCHQLPQRSLFILGLPMPVCGRCFFIYLGGTFILGSAVFGGLLRPWPPKVYVGFAIAILVEILLNKWFFMQEMVYLRYAAGFLLGVLLFRLLMEGLLYKGTDEKEGTVTE